MARQQQPGDRVQGPQRRFDPTVLYFPTEGAKVPQDDQQPAHGGKYGKT